MYDVIVRGGTVVSPAKSEVLDIAVLGDRIAAIGPPGSLGGEARKVIEARDCFVMPGGVDPHVHYSSPPIETVRGELYPEPQEYSLAAAVGGNTTIIDFVFQEPPLSLHQAIEDKKSQAEGRMAVDYGLHAVVTGDISFEVMDELGDVIRDGIPTIKTLTTYPRWMSDDGHRWGVMNEVREHGGMSLIHAEDDALAKWLTKKYVREGKTHGAYITEVRGPLVEEAAIRRALLLAERSGSPLYILHMAAGAGVEALAEARARGLPFYGETLATYLSFTADRLWDDTNRGLLWNTTPTIKYQEDQDVLLEAIADDRVQVVASDHSLINSVDRYDKMGTTIESMQSGNASVELRIPVLFHLGVQEGRMSVNRFVELASTNAAKIMGLYPRKGLLAVGSDADIVVLDPHRTWTVSVDDLHMSADYSCWAGWSLRGKVVTTVMRGSVLVENERFIGSAGGGRFVRRALLPEILATPRTPTATFESCQTSVVATNQAATTQTHTQAT